MFRRRIDQFREAPNNQAARRQVRDNIFNRDLYSLPKNITNSSLADLVNHPTLFSAPQKQEIQSRNERAVLRMNVAEVEGVGDQRPLERQAPERRLVEDFEQLVRPDMQVLTKCIYPNDFAYELVHYLYYMLPRNLETLPANLRRERYLPFYGRKPERDWIEEMLLALDPYDYLGTRYVIDFEGIMRAIQAPTQERLDAINEAMPGLLNAELAEQGGIFLDELARLMNADYGTDGNRVLRTIKNLVSDIIRSLFRMTTTIETVDFSLTAIHSQLADTVMSLEEYMAMLGNHPGVNRLCRYVYIACLRDAQEVLRGLPSKRFENQDLCMLRESEFLRNVSPAAYNALLACLGGNEGGQFFNAIGRNFNKQMFVASHMHQNLMSVAASSVTNSNDKNLKYFVVSATHVNDVIAALGLENADQLRDYCATLERSLPQNRRAALLAHCNPFSINRQIPEVVGGVFQQRDIIRATFILTQRRAIDMLGQ